MQTAKLPVWKLAIIWSSMSTVLEREGLSGEEFRVQALECGHRGLTSLVDELGRCHEECPVEEGI